MSLLHQKLKTTLDKTQTGVVLNQGISIAIIGKPNVGKSSLLNKIIGRRSLAHTSKTPGKTRLLNVYEIDSLFYLVDLL